jgi:hypothetical protein
MTGTVTVATRRARLVARHRLAAPAESVAAAADAMIALHATDPLTVYLSVWARGGCTTEDVDRAVYEERTLVRVLGMRRTMFLLPAALRPVVQAACTDDVARRLRRDLERDLERWAGIAEADGWLRDVGDGVLKGLRERGSGSGAELSRAEPRLRTQLVRESDKSYVTPQNITSRVLMLLSAEGLIVRGHRRGGWSSGQFAYYPADAWLGSAPAPVDAPAARAELARRWLLTFGPAPVSDLRWWAGWTGAQTKAALAALPVTDVDLDGQPGVMLADDRAEAEPPPVAALLPGLDPTPMGWQDRSWFLGPHAPPLFDRTGNIGPTVWWEGRVIGGWAQRPSGEVVYRLLEDAGSDAVAAVDSAASRLQTWLGDARVTPRYRVPLERELSA